MCVICVGSAIHAREARVIFPNLLNMSLKALQEIYICWQNIGRVESLISNPHDPGQKEHDPSDNDSSCMFFRYVIYGFANFCRRFTLVEIAVYSRL